MQKAPNERSRAVRNFRMVVSLGQGMGVGSDSVG